MTVVLTILAVGVALWLVIMALAASRVAMDKRKEAKRPSRVGQRVTVHTVKPDDQTLYGVVVGDYLDRLVLEDAEYVTPLGAKPLPGRQHIDRDKISWMDVHAMVAQPMDPRIMEKELEKIVERANS